MHECMVWITVKSNLFKECEINVKKVIRTYIPTLYFSYNGDKLDTFDILDYTVERYKNTRCNDGR